MRAQRRSQQLLMQLVQPAFKPLLLFLRRLLNDQTPQHDLRDFVPRFVAQPLRHIHHSPNPPGKLRLVEGAFGIFIAEQEEPHQRLGRLIPVQFLFDDADGEALEELLDLVEVVAEFEKDGIDVDR